MEIPHALRIVFRAGLVDVNAGGNMVAWSVLFNLTRFIFWVRLFNHSHFAKCWKVANFAGKSINITTKDENEYL